CAATYRRSGKRIGCAVGVQTSPVSWSRRYRTSGDGSLTGSFDHGVTWFSRLFSAHENAAPLAEITVTKPGLARTLTHGAGVSTPGSSATTYSRPSAAKPP